MRFKYNAVRREMRENWLDLGDQWVKGTVRMVFSRSRERNCLHKGRKILPGVERNCWQVGKHPPTREDNCLQVGRRTSSRQGKTQPPGREIASKQEELTASSRERKILLGRERHSPQAGMEAAGREGNSLQKNCFQVGRNPLGRETSSR